jgi:succinyl-CoA:acetate CoA-transferase
MISLIKSGKMTCASSTAFSLSPDMITEVYANIKDYKNSIILRPQEISNNPGIIRRLGVISMNAMIEGDIYGNVNSTHIMGSKMMNGIGGSGDFARNAFLSFFMAPSLAAKGAISTIVPMVSHVDHTEHDTQILVTDVGLADMRGLSPKQRARVVIDNCASDEYKPILNDYFERAKKSGNGMHTPHMLNEAHAFHERFLKTGNMRP